MTSVWKVLYYSTQKAKAMKGIQAILSFPELKIVKPSGSRCLSHERCVRAICKELPPLLQTLSQLYESHLEMLRHMVYSPFWLVLQLSPIRSSQCPCSLKLVHAEEDS